MTDYCSLENEIALLKSQLCAMEQLLTATEDAVIQRSIQLEAALKDLSEARDAALQASRSKSEFLANMSHEIRTPLNAIIGMTELLMRMGPTARQIELLNVVLEAGQSLLTIIGDILDFSKIEAGKLLIENLEFDLTELVEGAAQILAKQASAKSLSLTVQIDRNVPELVLGDDGRLRQILVNLIGNAVKFSDSGGVHVAVNLLAQVEEQAKLRFSVSDTGIGMSRQEISRLFTPFVQADGSTTRRFGGTGLGLSICKRLVKMMGGDEIEVESERGKGSNFSFTLPFAVSGSRKALPKVCPELQDLRILLVEDDKAVCQVMGAQLSTWKLRLTIMPSADLALTELLNARQAGDPYKIALVDLVLPGINGEEFLHRVHAKELESELSLVLITAYDQSGLCERMLNAGFKAYLRKPIRQALLLDCLNRLAKGECESLPDPVTAGSPMLSEKIGDGIRILLAEDNLANQKLAMLQLEELGVRADLVTNGKEAVESYLATEYDLVLMDCQMPLMDGMAATEEIRAFEKENEKRRTPIIALTASAMKGDMELCLKSGMDEYLSKPVRFDDLRRSLLKWLPKQKVADLPAVAQNAAILSQLDDSVSQENYLRSLTEVFGKSGVEEMMKSFSETSKESLAKIEACLDRKDSTDLNFAAHKLKGSAGIFRAVGMAELCFRLEEQAVRPDWQEVAELFQMLVYEYNRVESIFESALESSTST